MNILLVGAGAVGQVYARHLQLAGARVSFFVRPKAAEALRAGMVLYPIRRAHERVPVELHPDAIYTSLEDVAAKRWDQVWLCVPSDALDDAWLRSIAAATPDAVVVALPPGKDAEESIRRVFPGRRVVPALIGMISYLAPLPGELVPRPGIAYLFSSMRPSAFGGEDGRAVAELLAKGGCPAREDQDIGAGSAFGSSMLMPNVAALELAGWSLEELRRGRRGPWLDLAASASREALRITAARLGVPVPPIAHALHGFVLRAVWKAAPHLVPIDLEAYVRHHFTKVGAQTREMLAGYVRDGERLSIPAPDVKTLLAKLDAARASS